MGLCFLKGDEALSAKGIRHVGALIQSNKATQIAPPRPPPPQQKVFELFGQGWGSASGLLKTDEPPIRQAEVKRLQGDLKGAVNDATRALKFEPCAAAFSVRGQAAWGREWRSGGAWGAASFFWVLAGHVFFGGHGRFVFEGCPFLWWFLQGKNKKKVTIWGKGGHLGTACVFWRVPQPVHMEPEVFGGGGDKTEFFVWVPVWRCFFCRARLFLGTSILFEGTPAFSPGT